MSDPVANSVIVARGLEKTYPGPPSVRALGPVDLVITAGDYLAVRGPSGSGKSTLLNLLGLLDTPTGGSLHVAGVDTASLTENDRTALRGRCIGFVFQDFQLLSTQTAVENVALGLLYLGGKNADRLREARTTLDRVGLAHRADALPMTLSGGERQRVAIARALVGGPDLLLCDEPTGNLDSENSERILDLIDHLHSAGATVVVITHDESTAARARRSVVIRDGLLETHHG